VQGRLVGALSVRRAGGAAWSRDERAYAAAVADRLAVAVVAEARRRAEVALCEREQQVAHLERLAEMGSWEMDMESGRITWSREQLRIHGLDPDRPARTEADFLALVHPDDRARVVAAMQRLVATREPFTVEYRIVRPSGEVRLLDAPGQLVLDSDGRATRMIGTSRDITARRATELALRASEESYRTIFQHASDAIWVHDLHTGDFIELNEAAAEMYGYTIDESRALGVAGTCAGHPPYSWTRRASSCDARPRASRSASSGSGSTRTGARCGARCGCGASRSAGRTGSSPPRATSATASWPRRAAARERGARAPGGGAHRGARGEQRRAREEVAEHARCGRRCSGRTRELEGIFQALPDLYFRLDADQTIVDYRPGSSERLHLAPEALLGRRLREVMPAHICDRFDTAFAADPAALVCIEYRLNYPDGARDYEARFLPLADGTRISVVRDITERKDAERALQEREAQLRETQRIARLGSWQWDVATGALVWDPVLCELYGVTPATAPRDFAGYLALVHPDDRWLARWVCERALDVGRGVRRSTTACCLADGPVRHLHGRGSVTAAADGAPARLVGSAQDVSERKEAERALQEREERFRRLIENSSDQVMIVDTAGAVTYVGPSVERMLGYTPDEFLGIRPIDIVHPDDVPLVMEADRPPRRPPRRHDHHPVPHPAQGRQLAVFENLGRTVSPHSADEGLVANCRDVTERAMRRGGARAAQGGGGAGEPGEERVPEPDEPRAAHADEQHPRLRPAAGARRAAGAAGQVGGAHPQGGAPPAAAHQRGARDRPHRGRARELLARAGGRRPGAARGVRPRAAAGPAARRGPARGGVAGGRVRARRPAAAGAGAAQPPVERHQVQPPGGHVGLACAAAEGGRWAVRVADSGRGIPPERADQLFTPFARLGAEQTDVEGTGLGLALSQRLCEAMGGALTLETTGPAGSVFRVELDGAEDPLRSLEDTGTYPALAAPHRAATLLYVEDNLANLSLVETILLARPGWRTLPALQGQLGVELAREHLPDLVLLDLHLPDIPGLEVLRRLRADARTAPIPWSSSAPTPRRLARAPRAAGPTPTSRSRSTSTSSCASSSASSPPSPTRERPRGGHGRARRRRGGPRRAPARVHDPPRGRRGGQPRPARGAARERGLRVARARHRPARGAGARRAPRARPSCCSTSTCRTATASTCSATSASAPRPASTARCSCSPRT
jgi:PAS domain S-box-containing protein